MSIPLPALDVQTPQQPDLLSKFGQLAQLKNAQIQQQEAPLRMQALQQGVQAGGIDLQMKQQELKDNQAMSAAMQQWSQMPSKAGIPSSPGASSLPNYDDLVDLAKKNGASFKAIQGMQTSILGMKEKASTIAKNDAQTGASNANAIKTKNGMLTDALSGVMNLPDDQLVPGLLSAAQDLQQKGLLDPQHVQMAQQLAQSGDPAKIRQQLSTQVAGMGGFNKLLEDAQKKLQLEQEKGKTDPTSPLYAPTEASVAMGTAPGAKEIQAGKVKQAAAVAGADEAARLPGEMRLAAQRQALSQGDPTAAGQLLANHDMTLSEMKSRGVTPAFIAQALFAAKKINPTYNAQQDEAQFKVAQSPSNLAFFGSAKSLTDKGGTLDQLAEAAKAIPGNQIPVFNSLEDAAKAATGNGPIAKYASILVGVADDYSKVMGGGTGSDASRAQGFKLAAASASPAQRAGSIEGIRGAVGSQINSRIGNNSVLKRMYGGDGSTASGLSVTAPNGKVYTFKDQAAADAFKKNAGIQ